MHFLVKPPVFTMKQRNMAFLSTEKNWVLVIFFIQLLFGTHKFSLKFGGTLAHGATLAQHSSVLFNFTAHRSICGCQFLRMGQIKQ